MLQQIVVKSKNRPLIRCYFSTTSNSPLRVQPPQPRQQASRPHNPVIWCIEELLIIALSSISRLVLRTVHTTNFNNRTKTPTAAYPPLLRHNLLTLTKRACIALWSPINTNSSSFTTIRVLGPRVRQSLRRDQGNSRALSLAPHL